jgi:predicted nucleotide-binding protein (sugar kinase/HSP70/actin superfamily)
MHDVPPIIAPDVDLSGGKRSFVGLALQVGTAFTLSPLLIREAAIAAWESYGRLREDLRSGAVTPAALWRLPAAMPSPTSTSASAVRIAVVGHPYNLYDPFLNHSLLARLEGIGASVTTPERLGVGPGDDYWAFEYELVGAAKLAIRQRLVQGLIAVVAFGCGPDGVMQEQVRELGARAGIPVMVLTLDEHAGEAGLVTRLEAFVDMLRWRERRDGAIPRN